jgi:hypothetical protein
MVLPLIVLKGLKVQDQIDCCLSSRLAEDHLSPSHYDKGKRDRQTLSVITPSSYKRTGSVGLGPHPDDLI